MSAPGREIFDRYVAGYLNDPMQAGFSLQSHVFTLLTHARAENVPAQEMIEEVEALLEALAAARIDASDERERSTAGLLMPGGGCLFLFAHRGDAASETTICPEGSVRNNSPIAARDKRAWYRAVKPARPPRQ